METRGTLLQYRQFGVLGLILGSVIISAATDVPLLTFKVTGVNQELTDDGYRVRVYMTGSRLPQVYQIKNYVSQPTLLPLQEESYVEFYHDNSANGSSDADLAFLHPQGYQIMQVRLTNITVPEQLVPDVEILTKGKQIRFEKGQDVDLNVSVVTDKGMVNHIFTHFGFAVRSAKEKGIVTVHNVHSSDIISWVDQNDTDNGKITHLRLKTSSEESVEGLLEVDISFILNCRNEEDSCLINWYSIHEDVPVYQADHAGPFPTHFLGFMRHLYQQNTNETICSLHDYHPCMVVCELIGDQPSPVELVPTDQDPGHLVSIGRSSFANGGFRAMGLVTFAKGQVNQEGEYQCSSHSGPEVVSHTIRVLVVHEARINHSASYVKPLGDGIVEVNCEGSGTPAPTLTFYDRNDTVLNNVSSDLHEIVMTQPDEHTSVGVMRIFDRAEANRLRYVRCKVENVIFGHHFEDSIRSLYVAQEESPTINPMVSYYMQQFLTTT